MTSLLGRIFRRRRKDYVDRRDWKTEFRKAGRPGDVRYLGTLKSRKRDNNR